MYDWQKAQIHQDQTLIEVLSIIDQEALRIALVVDDDHKLVGILTDGDVRKALLEHGNLQVSAKSAMNTTPIVAREGTSVSALNNMLKERNVLAIPVVSDSGQLVGLHTIQYLTQKPVKENPVFIMAGGFGTRLRPLTDNCPKPMLKVGNKPILETILDCFLKAGFKNFYFSTHYLPEVITDYFGDGGKFGCSIHYVHEEVPLGTGGALGLLPDDLPDLPIIMINGDVLTNVDLNKLLEDHEEKGNIATMCVRQHQYQIPYGVIKEEDGCVVGVEEKPTKSFFINAGVYVFNRSLLDRVPANQKIDMPPLLMQQVSQGESVNIFPIHEYWLDIGQHGEFERAQREIDQWSVK